MIITENKEDKFQTIYLGGGCFWCVEAVFEDVKGVIDVTSGFAGGKLKNPTYKQVVNGYTNHAETCKITFDNSKINLENILEIFFLTHDPTSLNRQGNDIGTHYRSIILFNNNTEKDIINKYIAENYHQGYYKLNTEQPYCNAVITPKVSKARKLLEKYY
jgi:peptide-methionine (S)-S-oxide reductase